MKTNNPYIGPRSFTRKERDRFFGREVEAGDLLSLIIAERLVLFYAQSGAGKTSLINTSLIPGLEENARIVLPVGRVGGELPAGITDVDNVFVFSLMSQLDQGGTDPAVLASLKLSAFLRDLVTSDGRTYQYDPPHEDETYDGDFDDGPICVLIIDQFEEILLAHPDRWQDKADFFVQLNQVMRDDPKLSVVLSLREDYVAALEPYEPLLADRMRARFYMERMCRRAARAAVKQPAAKAGRPFAPGAAETLVDNLSLIRSARSSEPRPGQYIEPVQLQVVCFQLWRNLPPGEDITLEQVGQIGNVDHALADFYERAVFETLSKAGGSELALRQWVDRKLITSGGTRGTVFQGEKMTDGMENRVVRLLEDRFLLRAESRSGAVWYELVHDRFVEPILQANRQWLDRQGPLLRDALAWLDSNKRNRSLLYTGEKLAMTLADFEDLPVHEPVVMEFLEGCKGRQAWLDEKESANKKYRKWFKAAVLVTEVAMLVGIWAGVATWRAKNAEQSALDAHKKAKDTLARLQKTESLNIGMTLNAKGESEESKRHNLNAHLYSLHAIERLSRDNKESKAYKEAVGRAQANPVPVPAFIGHHDGQVNDVVFSSDGRTVASASRKEIKIWNAVTGKQLRSLPGQKEGVSSIAFSPDGRLLASGSSDTTIVLWEASTGKRVRTLKGHTDRVGNIVFSPNGRLLASTSKDMTIGIWSVKSGKRLYSLNGESNVSRVAFSPDGRNIAATFYDGTVGVWEVKGGKCSEVLDGYTTALHGISFSPDMRTVAAGSFGRVDFWDVKKGERLRTIKRDDNWLITTVPFSADGRVIASGSGSNIISLQDVETGEYLRMLEGTSSGRDIDFSPDGQTLVASGSRNNTLGLWETYSGRLHHLKGHVGQVVTLWFSKKQNQIVSISRDKTIARWDTATGRLLQKKEIDIARTDPVIFSSDGRIFATFSYGGSEIRIGKVATGKWLAQLDAGTYIDSIAFSADSQSLAAASGSTIKVWDLLTEKCSRTFTLEEGMRGVVTFSPDGGLFAANVGSGTIGIWELATGKRVQILEGGSGFGIFSPDRRLFAHFDTQAKPPIVKIWDIASGKTIQTLRESSDVLMFQAKFSPSGNLLASSSLEKKLNIWDVRTGTRLHILKEKNISYESIVAFSPDDQYLVFTTEDNAVGIWDFYPAANEFSGISLDKNGGYTVDLQTLPYTLEGIELKPLNIQGGNWDKAARWSRYHPFHWLPAAEKGDSKAMLQLGIIYDRKNDIARALRWYKKAFKAGKKQARKQESILLHWLEDKDNWKRVPEPFRRDFCKAKKEFKLPLALSLACTQKRYPDVIPEKVLKKIKKNRSSIKRPKGMSFPTLSRKLRESQRTPSRYTRSRSAPRTPPKKKRTFLDFFHNLGIR
ncbi:MAG: hypothetical protein Q3M24_11725 [Candidatus Electrothrix aestuarii]|uniref:Novel STAND NTPase 1 domain-containing protein n=1 Tax=Candidatus Electrothrix aestuarii TaxID=3062594 RepID=A0AAU8M2P1_9BACT|nr:hypothetical protein [Candidatus Electrothrix aestuarii]